MTRRIYLEKADDLRRCAARLRDQGDSLLDGRARTGCDDFGATYRKAQQCYITADRLETSACQEDAKARAADAALS